MAKIFKNKIILIILVAALAGGGLYAYSAWRNTGTPAYAPKQVDTAQQANTGSKPATATSKPASGTAAIPQSSAPQTSPGGGTIIATPHQGDTVTSGSTVTGTTTAKSIYYRLKTVNNGQVAGTGPITVTNGSYSFQLLFSKEIKGGTDQGTLQIYTYDGGSEADIANVNVYVQG